jgi:hypothetical protein
MVDSYPAKIMFSFVATMPGGDEMSETAFLNTIKVAETGKKMVLIV